MLLGVQKYTHPEVEVSICNTHVCWLKRKKHTLFHFAEQLLSSWTQSNAMENAKFCYRGVWGPTLSASSIPLSAGTEKAYKQSLPQINLYPLHKKCAGHFVLKFSLLTWGSHTAYTDMRSPWEQGRSLIFYFLLRSLDWKHFSDFDGPFNTLPTPALPRAVFHHNHEANNAETHCSSWKKTNSLSELLLLQ